MNDSSLQAAAEMLVAARRSGARIADLPSGLRPESMMEAHAIQDAATRLLGAAVGGYKVYQPADDALSRGALLTDRIFAGPARIPAALIPFLGIEAEIAFRLDRALPFRAASYGREEVADAVSVCPAIEILSPRYVDFDAVDFRTRVADHVGNGAFVHGTMLADWQRFDLASAETRLFIDDALAMRTKGQHLTGDPLLPVLYLANLGRSETGLQGGLEAGLIVTTGSLTGVTRLRPGQTARVEIDHIGSVEALFPA